MKDNSTTATPEAWKMRFLANGTSGTWFYTDDIVNATMFDRYLPFSCPLRYFRY
ncbi:hypothetical protein AB2F40_18860 [Escherichia coli]